MRKGLFFVLWFFKTGRVPVFDTYQDAERFADLMERDPNLRQLFFAFMVFEGLDMMSIAQNLAVNNRVRRFSHRCKL